MWVPHIGADVADTHLFPNPNNVAPMLNVRALIPAGQAPAFDPDVLHQFKINVTGDYVEELVIQARFTGTGTSQRVVISGLAPLRGLAWLMPQTAAKAVRLWGAAEALCEIIGPWLFLSEQGMYNRRVTQARVAPDGDAFAAAWEAGRAPIWEQAVEYALEGILVLYRVVAQYGLNG